MSEKGKRALITGITGQDGAYLAELLLDKGYEVHGLQRSASVANTERLAHRLEAAEGAEAFHLHHGDLTDSTNVVRVLREVGPAEVYNLGAQSHVRVSFETPEYTANSDGVGTLRLLEGIRALGMAERVRFYQASTSEMFGKARECPQTERTPFHPRSPYAVAKVYAYWITVNYREAYGLFACNGILFNHESPLRGETFVTRKITRAVARIHAGLEDVLLLGNLDARRDWGYAGDYVRAMWLMLQQDAPDDYVVATGETRSVREFAEMAFAEAGYPLEWRGVGVDEQGVDPRDGRVLVRIDPRYFRPAEVDDLEGDASKARDRLGWTPTVSFEDLVRRMVREDLRAAERERFCRREGFGPYRPGQ